MSDIIDKVNIRLSDDQQSKLLGHEVVLAEMGENLIEAASAREACAHLPKNEIASAIQSAASPRGANADRLAA